MNHITEKPAPVPANAGNLLADMNHEIRTSMNGIVGMLELLLDTDLSSSQQQFATIAQNSVENLLELIEDMVDLSMIESRQIALTHSPFDLRQEMRAACALQRAAMCERGLDLNVQYPPTMLLSGDPMRVRQVIASLLNTAVDLAGGGEIMVAADTGNAADDRCRVRVSVIAAGLALDATQLTGILDQPPRTIVAAMRPYGRAGLELALCRELAAMMGGRIGIDCLPQQRTEFWLVLDLPLQPDQPAATKVAPAPQAIPTARPAGALSTIAPALEGRRVLVADDNPVNQQIAQRMLEKMGAVADVACDGQQALEMHLGARYDLILMDCEMPGVDGFRATELIRSLESGSRTPVIALTACTSQQERDRCLAAGMDDFLSKPIRAQTIKDMLARWLPDRPAATSTTPVGGDELEEIQAMFGADFSDLARLYLNDSPARLLALRGALTAGDHARVAQIAHAFGGSSASIGAIALSALCRELELAAKAGATAELGCLLAMVDAAYADVDGRLRALVSGD